MHTEVLELLSNPFLNLSHRLVAKVPNFVAAFLFLLIGLFIARALRTLAERVLDRAHLDDHMGRVGINEVLARLGMGRSPAYGISFLIYWFILLAFFVSAANAVELTVVSELLERFMLFLPSLIAAILILFAGLVFSRFLAEVVANAAAANTVRGGEWLAKGASAVVLSFSGLMALEQLGIQMALLSSGIQILFASLGLTFALAFGLGGKEIAAELLRDLLNRRKEG